MTDLNCPYCNAEQDVDTEYYDGQEDTRYEHECSECKKVFVYTMQTHFTFEPYKSDCLNGSQHKYKLTKTWPKEFSRMQCEDCHDERELTEEERVSNNIRTKQEFMDELDASVKALNEQQEINNINKLAGRLKISKELDAILDIQELD